MPRDTRQIPSIIFSILVVCGQCFGRDIPSGSPLAADNTPAYCVAIHNIGSLRLAVQNNGTIGLYRDFFNRSYADCFTGSRISLGAEFPKQTLLESLFYASLWVGAVIGDDTLVSTGMDGFGEGQEFHPAASPFGEMIYRSIIDPDLPEFEDAISEQDFIAVYTDTMRGSSRDYFYSRAHQPLDIEVTQRSFAWSYPYAEDVVLVDMSIKNIGFRDLNDVYIGLYVDNNVGFNGGYPFDDLCGFMETYKFRTDCGIFEDTLEIAWTADNDGDPINGEFIVTPGLGSPSMFIQRKSAPHATGIRVLRKPDEDATMSFNWWISSVESRFDFGPRHKANLRDFRTGGLGTPEGDVNKYYQMSNGEIDYDQVFTGEVLPTDPTWMLPAEYTAYRASVGMDTRYLLSYGPVTIPTSESVPFTFAYLGAKDFHTLPGNGNYLWFATDRYFGNLSFEDLAENGRWASWLFDNPGIDTDGDGYYGKFTVCVKESIRTDSEWVVTLADTSYYTGDGIPDFRGAAPPPAPQLKLYSIVNGIRVVFNGQMSELTRDFLTNVVDFEGYNIYLARDERATSYSLVAAYDIDNYDKFVWRGRLYELMDAPFPRDSLVCLYGQSCDDEYFDPLNYTSGHPFVHPNFPDSLFHFSPHASNASELGVTTPIIKVYPDAPPLPPRTNIDTLGEEWFTEDGLLKYYEYEFVIENLLPTVPYWVSVTAYDQGSPKSDLDALETSVTLNAQMKYPYSSDDQVAGEDLEVYIYPNPWRIDAEYRRFGFEGRGDNFFPDNRLRKLHFANLPSRCTIRIFSLDGDLVRELHHDMDPSDPNSRHDAWDLIGRNTQEVVSGIYYWTVEDENGRVQMGKLVVLM